MKFVILLLFVHMLSIIFFWTCILFIFCPATLYAMSRSMNDANLKRVCVIHLLRQVDKEPK